MEKIKHIIINSLESEKGKDILIVIIVILVGLGSFGLGRLSKGGQNPGIEIEYTDETLPKIENQEASVISSITSSSLLQNTEIENPTGKTFFASNRGTKYYSVGCSAGKTIKQENRIYFGTREEAERAGYELSSSCQ